jgi:hypothetical protein
MIAKLEIKTQYGKDDNKSTNGIRTLHQFDSAIETTFAHSIEDATNWARSFSGALVEKFDNGTTIITSEWVERDSTIDAIFDMGEFAQAKYTRQYILITAVNTIYENVGQGGKRES